MDGRWTMTAQAAAGTADDGQVECWCCGAHRAADAVVRLGNHPEVALCLRCAHWAHRQARAREDAGRRSPAVRARDLLRAERAAVIRHGWQHLPVIGPLLRRLGRRLP